MDHVCMICIFGAITSASWLDHMQMDSKPEEQVKNQLFRAIRNKLHTVLTAVIST